MSSAAVPEEAPKPSLLLGVLIGIDFYHDLPALSCAVNDAELHFEVLHSCRLQTDLTLLTNGDASAAAVADEVRRIGGKLEPNDSFLLTFSGHGSRTTGVGEAVFLTADYRGGTTFADDGGAGGFTLTQVCRWLDEGLNGRPGPKNIVILLDACESGRAVMDASGDDAVPGGDLRPRGVRRSAKKQPDEPLLIDRQQTPWPRQSAVAIVCAALNGNAWEDLARGQGIFTYLSLQWWRLALASGKPIESLGDELHTYVSQQLARFDPRTNSTLREWQDPIKSVRGKVTFGDERHWIRFKRTSGPLPVDSLYPPTPIEPEEVLAQAHNLKQLKTFLKDDARSAPECAPQELSNILVVSDRLMSANLQVAAVVHELTRDFEIENRSVLCLSANYLQSTLPFSSVICAWRVRRWAQLDWTREPPHLDLSSHDAIDALVHRLGRERALVVVPLRDTPPGSEVHYFLERCADHPDVRLCLIVHHDEKVPFAFRSRPHRRLVLKPRAVQFLGCRKNRTRRGRLKVLSPRLRSWLAVLGRKQLTEEARALLRANRNDLVTVTLQLIDEVLSSLTRKPGGETALLLLTAMSVIRLPRPLTLVQALWEELKELPGVLRTEEPLPTALELLRQHFLIDQPHTDQPGSVFYLHNLVLHAVGRRAFRSKADGTAQPDWHLLAARAYARLFPPKLPPTPPTAPPGPTWPQAILAHEALTHCEQAGAWFLLAQLLTRDRIWKSLVNAGYQNLVLQWTEQLKSRLCRATNLELDLLLQEQSLRRHRQEFGRILDLHDMIVRRTSARQVGDEWVFEGNWDSYFWRSYTNVGDYHIARRDYLSALAVYAHGLSWAKSRSDPHALRIALHCRLRAAYCLAGQGAHEEAKQACAQAELLLQRLEEPERASARIRLLAVHCELARLREDAKELYAYAVQLWRASLAMTAVEEESEKNNLRLAIARLHLAWACLMRGEPVRAWYHALRSRQYLNARGIAEYWWVAETERVAGLAMAWTLRRPSFANLAPWTKGGYKVDGQVRRAVQEQVPTQVNYLKRLIELCQESNPWRAAELRSALGQVLFHNGQSEEGTAVLREALASARAHNHSVLAGYILEAMAEDLSDAPSKYHLEAARVSAGLGLWQQAARRLGNATLLSQVSAVDVPPVRIEANGAGVSAADVQRLVGALRQPGQGASQERRHVRYPCLLQVELRRGSERIRGHLLDVSAGGFRGVFRDPVPRQPPDQLSQPDDTVTLHLLPDETAATQAEDVAVVAWASFKPAPSDEHSLEPPQRLPFIAGIRGILARPPAVLGLGLDCAR